MLRSAGHVIEKLGYAASYLVPSVTTIRALRRKYEPWQDNAFPAIICGATDIAKPIILYSFYLASQPNKEYFWPYVLAAYILMTLMGVAAIRKPPDIANVHRYGKQS